jgi:MFS family permease
VPLHKRPLYQGIISSVFGIASVVGPLLGGAFTSHVTWRWCFYINLPLGGLALVIISLLLKIPDRDTTKIPTKAKLAQLDFYGTALIIPGTVCLNLALQWGGLMYSVSQSLLTMISSFDTKFLNLQWNDDRIVALLVLSGVLLVGFVLVQVFMPKTATIASRIFTQRSILAGFFSTLCTGGQMVIFCKCYKALWTSVTRID